MTTRCTDRWLMIYALYIATFAGAVALLLMMPRQGFNPRAFGGLLGAMALGGAWLWLWPQMSGSSGLDAGALPYYYIFSGLAIAAAVRVITHTNPVYSALWFIMVVLASSGLFIVLDAEFMAFAVVIIYGGAILVTYIFVIMLATQSGDEDQGSEDSLLHNAVAREPVAGVIAGFLLLAMLLTIAFPSEGRAFVPNPQAATVSDAQLIETVLVERGSSLLADKLNPDQLTTGPRAEMTAELGQVRNVERLGVDLFQKHPLGLELAGIILLVALVGAVVIAKQKTPQEEKPTPAQPGPGGATAHPTTEPGPHDDETLEAQSSGRLGV